MTHVWGYRIPVLVAPVLVLYAVGAVWFLWRGRAQPWVTLERVLLAGALVGASAVTMTPTSFLDPEVFGRAGTPLLAGVVALPVLFETVQWAFPDLNRACDVTDLVDNLTGVAAGLLVGTGIAALRWAVRRKVGIVAA